MQGRSTFTLSLCIWAGMVAAACGVVVSGGTSAENTTAPAVDFGLNQIGYINGASAVYLGGGWMLSAYHVVGEVLWAGSVSLNGADYQTVVGSGVRLHDADGTEADLILFRLDTVPQNLTGAVISSAPMQLDTPVVMAGFGLDREDHVSYTGGPLGNLGTGLAGDYRGYQLRRSNRLHWGTNSTILLDGEPTRAIDDGYGITQMFQTAFDEIDGEAQAALGDSGGGVFRWVGNRYELCGIMLAISTYSSQPSDFTAYGNSTFSADLTVYRDQIFQVIPEPSMGLLLMAGAAILTHARWRARG